MQVRIIKCKHTKRLNESSTSTLYIHKKILYSCLHDKFFIEGRSYESHSHLASLASGCINNSDINNIDISYVEII